MSKPSAAARMGTEPLNPLLLSLAIPMMISMLVQALYNVVDSIFVSYVNEAALSAVSLAFPIQNLLIAFAVGTAVGVNAHLSKSLGEGNREEAERAAMNGLFLAVCSALGFLLFGLFGAEAFITSQTSDPLIARYGAEYLTICTVFSIGCCLQCMMEKVLVASGHSTYAMITQMVGALTNIVLDPVMVSTSGSRLIREEAVETMREMLFPLAEIITPNVPETEALTGARIRNTEDMERAAKALQAACGCAVLCKGGHRVNDANDLLCMDGELHWFLGKRVDNPNTHGTGCTLSSAIASNLALGHSLEDSVRRAKEYLTGALEAGLDLGKGSGPVNHMYRFFEKDTE